MNAVLRLGAERRKGRIETMLASIDQLVSLTPKEAKALEPAELELAIRARRILDHQAASLAAKPFVMP